MSLTPKQIMETALAKAIENLQKGNLGRAEELSRQVLNIEPKNKNGLKVLALIAHFTKNNEDAIKYFNMVLEQDKDDTDAMVNIALVYSKLNKHELALNYLSRVLEIDQSNSAAILNLPAVYKDLGMMENAEDAYLKAVDLLNDADSYYNLGNFYKETGRYQLAIDCYNVSLEKNPNHKSAKFNRAATNLTIGNFLDGFRDYEARWDAYPHYAKARDDYRITCWNGTDDLHGKRVLVYSEQGVGDLIQFIRYLPLVKSLGAIITVHCSEYLEPIIKKCKGVDSTITVSKREDLKTETYDYQISLLSLPFYFKTNINETPNKVPYLWVNEEDLKQSNNDYLLNPKSWEPYSSYFKVGIVWAGNPRHPADSKRSTYLKHFKNLLMPKVKLFSLQMDTRPRYWSTTNEIHDLTEGSEGMDIVDLSMLINNSWNNTAAIMQQMDLIVSVDTGLIHLAGAMGIPTWVLIAKINDWRWMADRSDSPWYPSLTIFRQKNNDDWEELFSRVGEELERKINCRT